MYIWQFWHKIQNMTFILWHSRSHHCIDVSLYGITVHLVYINGYHVSIVAKYIRMVCHKLHLHIKCIYDNFDTKFRMTFPLWFFAALASLLRVSHCITVLLVYRVYIDTWLSCSYCPELECSPWDWEVVSSNSVESQQWFTVNFHANYGDTPHE